MHGAGSWCDNVFVERLWWTVKYEEVYLRAYTSVFEARASITRYLGFCNGTRPHSSLGGQTADRAYLNQLTPTPAAAQPGRRSTQHQPQSCSYNLGQLSLPLVFRTCDSSRVIR
jgi:transposase InsO family protein